jgi:hypothetical protein
MEWKYRIWNSNCKFKIETAEVSEEVRCPVESSVCEMGEGAPEKTWIRFMSRTNCIQEYCAMAKKWQTRCSTSTASKIFPLHILRHY